MDIQTILDRYTQVSLNDLDIKKDLFDFEKELILEEKSNIPNLVIDSSRPFDKNYCFYDLPLNNNVKENIFPKTKYTLKSQHTTGIISLNIDSFFKEINNIKNNNNKINENRDKKLEIKNYYKSGEINFNLNKNKMTEKEEKEKKEEHPTEYKNKWYIIKGDENLGPFNDYDLFKKINDIFYENITKENKVPYYLVKEENYDYYYTMEECYFNLYKQFKFEIPENMTMFVCFKPPYYKNKDNDEKNGKDGDTKNKENAKNNNEYDNSNNNNNKNINNNNRNRGGYNRYNNNQRFNNRNNLNNRYNNYYGRGNYGYNNGNRYYKNNNKFYGYTSGVQKSFNTYGHNRFEKNYEKRNIVNIDINSVFDGKNYFI